MSNKARALPRRHRVARCARPVPGRWRRIVMLAFFPWGPCRRTTGRRGLVTSGGHEVTSLGVVSAALRRLRVGLVAGPGAGVAGALAGRPRPLGAALD